MSQKRKWTDIDTFDLARRWGPIFGCPPATIMAITEIESAQDPSRVNPARADKGGAWGLGQQMADEADEKLGRIRRGFLSANPELAPVLARWKIRPKKLADLDAIAKAGKLDEAKTKEFKDVVETLHSHGVFPENLNDPELNIIMVAWQLGGLHKEFGDFPTVAAAYHQGAGAVRSRLAAGEQPVGKQQPKGRAYVAMATHAYDKFAQGPMILALAR